VNGTCSVADVESGEGIESGHSACLALSDHGQVESGEGIERITISAQLENRVGNMWNPVKELKVASCVRPSRNRTAMWNPVKELKALSQTGSPSSVPSPWNPVESGEGIESRRLQDRVSAAAWDIRGGIR